MKGSKCLFELSVDARLLADRLRSVEPSCDVSYAELSEIIGRDVQRSARSVLASARKFVVREDSIVFGVVLNVGLRRLTDAEIVDTSDRASRHINRAAGKAISLITRARYEVLDRAHQIRHNAAISTFGAIAVFSSHPGRKKVEVVVAQNNAPLPLAGTVRLFQ